MRTRVHVADLEHDPNSHDHPMSKPQPTNSLSLKHEPVEHIVAAGRGFAFPVPKGKHFRVVDLHGEQVVDLMAWVYKPTLGKPTLERMSTAYTRYHLRGVTPTIGEALYTNDNRAILRITADTVKVHDMTYMACFPAMYANKGLLGHRSCAQNIFEVMKKYGMENILEVPEPFNCFQNTPNYSLKAMGSSKPGDYVEFEALEEVLVAVSCCPYDIDRFNGGEITDIAVVVD